MKSLLLMACLCMSLAGCESEPAECFPVDGICPRECGVPIEAREYGCGSGAMVVAACGSHRDFASSEDAMCARRTADGKLFQFPLAGVSYTRFVACTNEDVAALICEADAGVDASRADAD